MLGCFRMMTPDWKNSRHSLLLNIGPTHRKETPMQYKTIVMELLEQNPELHNHLKQNRKLLETIDTMALELKLRREQTIAELAEQQPDVESSVICSQATEIAIAELQQRLAPTSDHETREAMSLDQIMASVIQHSRRE